MRKGPLRSLALGASLAVAGFFGYQLKQMRDFGKSFQSLKEETAAQYAYQRDPTLENKQGYQLAFEKHLKLRREKGIYDQGKYFRQGGILYAKREENNSTFAGKIVEPPKKFGGFKVYLTRTNHGMFRGISTLESEIYNTANNFIFEDIDGMPAINVDYGAIEDRARDFARNWRKTVKNNEYLRNNDPRWDRLLQPAYLEHRDLLEEASKSKQKEEEIEGGLGDGFKKRSVYETEVHELTHIKTKFSGKEYSVEELEEIAYLKALSKTGSVDHIERGVNSGMHKDLKKRILQDLYSVCGAKDSREFYSKASIEDVKLGAAKLLERKYSGL